MLKFRIIIYETSEDMKTRHNPSHGIELEEYETQKQNKKINNATRNYTR